MPLRSWADCHIASQLSARHLRAVRPVQHETVRRLLLYGTPEGVGGALVLEGHCGGVFAIRHETDKALARDWRTSLRFYGGAA